MKAKVNFPPRQNFFKLDLQFFNNKEDEAYQTLGLPKESSEEEIKKAYKELSEKWLSDKNGNSEESKEKFQKISNAYRILINKIEQEEEANNAQEEWWTGKSYDELIEDIKELEGKLYLSAEIGSQLLKDKKELEIKLEKVYQIDKIRREKISELSWQVNQSWKSIQNLNNRINSENQIEVESQKDFEEAIDNLNNNFQQLQDKLISKERKIADNNDELGRLQKEIVRQEEARKQTDAKINDLKVQIESLKKENNRLFRKNSNLEYSELELENKKNSLEKSLEDSQNNKKVLKLELADTKEKLIEVNGLLEAKNNELVDLANKSAKSFADQTRENEKLLAENQRMQTNLVRIYEEIEKVVSENEKLANRAENADLKIFDLEGQIIDLQQELKFAKRESSNWERKYQKLEGSKKENLTIFDKLKTADEQIEELKKANEEALKALKQKDRQLNELQKEKDGNNNQKAKNNSSWKSTIKKIGISYLAGFATYGTYNWNQGSNYGENNLSLTNFNSTTNIPNCPNFTQSIYQNIPFNKNENDLLQHLVFNNDLNKELTDIKSFVRELEDKGLVENPNLANQRGVKIFELIDKLAKKRKEISDLQAQIDQQKSEKGLTVHGSGVNDLMEKITELEWEKIKLQKKIQRSRDELEKTKNAYQQLEDQSKTTQNELAEWTKTFADEIPQQVWLRLNQTKTALTQRPNITHEQYYKLQTDQRPDNLPDDWQEQLDKIPSLKTEKTNAQANVTALKQQISNAEIILQDQLGDNTITLGNLSTKLPNYRQGWINPHDKKARQKAGLQTDDEVNAKLSEAVRNARQQETDKYKGFIDLNDKNKLKKAAEENGFGFTQEDIDKAVETEKEKWTGYVDPKVYRIDWISPANLKVEAEKKGMVPGTKFQEIETSLKNANETIAKTQIHLGIDKLKNLPPLNGKTLAKLLADSNQLGQLSDILKDNFNLTDLTEWYKHLAKKEDLDKAKEQLKKYRDNLISLGIIDLDNWLQQVQNWKNADWVVKNLQNKLKNRLGLNDTNFANWEKEVIKLQNRLTQEQIDDKYQGWKSPQEITAEKEEFENKINKLQQEIVAFKQRIKKLNEHKSQQSKQIEEEIKQRTSLEQQLQTEQKAHQLTKKTQVRITASYEIRLNKLKENVGELVRQINDLTEINQKVQQEKEELLAKIDTIQTNQTQREKTTQQTITNLQGKVKKAEKLDERQKQEINSLRKLKTDLESKLSESQNNQNIERKKYQKELNDLRAKKLNSEKELWTQIHDKEKQIDKLNNDWQEKEANLNQKIIQLNTELQLINTLASGKETLIKELENKTQTLQTELAQTKIDYENQITSLQLIITASQQTLKDLNVKLKEKDRIITNSKRQLEREKDKLTTLRRQKRLGEKTLNQQISSLQRKSESEKNKLNEKLIQLKTELDQEKKTNQQSQAKINDWQTQIKNIAENIAAKLAMVGAGYLAKKFVSNEQVNQNSEDSDKEIKIEQLETKFKSEQTSHAKTKEERDNKEKEIIQKLNTDLNLNLTNPTLKHVITKIKELINKPSTIIIDNEKVDSLEKDLVHARQTIQNLQVQLQAQKPNILLGEDLANIINLEKETMSKILSKQLFTIYERQLNQITNYEQLAHHRQAIIKQHLAQNTNQEIIQPKNNLTRQPQIERMILFILLAISLLTIGGLLIKWKRKKSKK